MQAFEVAEILEVHRIVDRVVCGDDDIATTITALIAWKHDGLTDDAPKPPKAKAAKSTRELPDDEPAF